MLRVRTPEQFAPLIEKYKKDIENAEPVGGYVNNNIMVTTQMLCLEDGGRAREIVYDLESATTSASCSVTSTPSRARRGSLSGPSSSPTRPPSRSRSRSSAGDIAVGDPGEVAKAIQRFADIGADQLSFGMLSSSMTGETCNEAMATFGKHVLPQFDKDPVHSTTRQREAQVG